MDADFAVVVPHIPVRVWVMGQRAIDREPATGADMRQMADLVREGLDAGAFGFSTTRVIGHRTASGEQLPVTTASEDELMTIALAMKPFGKSLFMSASEFDTANGFSSEFGMLARIAEKSEQTVTFPLLQYNEAPDRWREIADACAAERRKGIDIYGQVVGRPVGVLYGLQLTLHPFRGCPTYERIDHLPIAERAAEMRKPEVRAAILAETELPLDPKYPPFVREIHLCYAMGAVPVYSPDEADRFDNVAARRGCSVYEVAYDALIADDGHGILYFPARNFTHYNLDVVHDMLGREETILGLGDGGAHVGAICDGSMQTFMLGYWTRDRQGDRLTIPEAVRLMTSHTAEVGGFRDRGLIAPGYKGDLNIIDYDNLTLSAPRAVFDLPAGGPAADAGRQGLCRDYRVRRRHPPRRQADRRTARSTRPRPASGARADPGGGALMLLNRDRADQIMDREGIAAIVASTPINTYYLSSWATDASWGFGDLALALLPRDHALEPAVLTVEVDAGQPQQRDGTWMTTVRGYARKPGIGKPAARRAR